jgi:uncharacterized protein
LPSTFTYPGVYVEEIPSGVHPIAGVSTSDTAFVDFFSRGPVGVATAVRSLTEFDRVFGGLDPRSEASYAVYQFFVNGGSTAWILRLAVTGTGASPPTPARASAKLEESGGADVLTIWAANAGSWGNALQVAIDNRDPHTFDVVVREVTPASGPTYTVLRTEVFRNLVVTPSSPQYVETVINAGSSLITATATEPAAPTAPTIPKPTDAAVSDVTIASVISSSDIGPFTPLAHGDDGLAPGDDANTFAAAISSEALTPLIQVAPYKINLLCIPVAAMLGAANWVTISNLAASICDANRIFYIADVPRNTDTATEAAGLTSLDDANTALYFPRLWMPDRLAGNLPRDIGASGAVAGIYARTDVQRGVWKAPAGTDASLRGATLQTQLDDADDGSLNVIGINVLRTFPVNGSVVWGSRTTTGADALASEWKYVPVRRTALYIEESLAQGLRWVVFEPNDEPLWRQIRTNVWAFMNDLFRQGAFAGATPADAFLVKCDKDTTIPSDVDRGIVNIIVGFQPLQPAEFVVLQIQQLAGQST